MHSERARPGHKWLLLSVAALAALGSGVLLRAVNSRPVLVVPAVIELGEVEPGSVVDYELLLRNDGNAALRLTNAKSSCGCLKPADVPAILEAGREKQVKLRLEMPKNASRYSSRLLLETNDPDQPIVTVEFKAVVKADLVVRPGVINFGYIRAPGVYEQMVRLDGPASADELEVHSPFEWLRAELTREEDQNSVLRLHIAPTAPRGSIQGTIVVTPVRGRPIQLPLRGHIDRGILAVPGTAFFGLLKSDKPAMQEITLKILDPAWQSPRIQSVGHPAIRAELRTVGAEALTLIIFADSTSASSQLVSEVTLSNEAGDEFTIPIIAAKPRR